MTVIRLFPEGMRVFDGYASALPTPFRDDAESIDEEAFAAFCDWQISQGVACLVVCGTTGEAPTLTADEHRRLVRLAVDVADGRARVIAGAGSNATAAAVALARAAQAEGADGVLAVTPYYNKPTQEGMYWHFRAIADATDLPVILYDVPSRTGCCLAVETVARLAELPRVIGLKDASGDLARVGQLRRLVGDEFRLLAGDDATALGFMALGGDGCISVVSNVVPALCVRMHAAYMSGDPQEARRISLALAELAAVLFRESNPVPVKLALGLMGRMSDAVRLPLCRATEETCRKVEAALGRLAVPTEEPAATPVRRRYAV